GADQRQGSSGPPFLPARDGLHRRQSRLARICRASALAPSRPTMKTAKPPALRPEAPFNDAFRSLADRRGELPNREIPEPAKAYSLAPAKAVIRFERKGRGGKEVTVVDQLALSERELFEWLRDLKQQLGCGGSVEDGALVLQGNQCRRVRTFLQERKVAQIK